MVNTKTGWHPEDVKAAIRKRGVTLTELSRKHRLSDRGIGTALHKPWPRVERIIAKFLETTPQAIWPERYDSKGRSKSRSPGRPRKEAA